MSLGSRIATAVRRERERAGVSAAELARRSGVSKATMGGMLHGPAPPLDARRGAAPRYSFNERKVKTTLKLVYAGPERRIVGLCSDINH